jgi:hypothetical protein
VNAPWRTACEVHRTALHDFVDHRAGYDPGTSRDVAAALDHLERCRDCEQELAATALVIAALRRLSVDISEAEPSPDAWLRLANRLERPKPRRMLLSSPLAGLALSAGLVVAMVAPQLGLDLVRSPAESIGPLTGADAAALIEEQRWLRDRTLVVPRAASAHAAALPSPPRRERIGPDGVQFIRAAPQYDAPPGRQH